MESKQRPSGVATDMAIDQMPDTPKRGSHHRRAHSDTSFRFPNLDELLLFDTSDLDLSALPSPSPSPSPSPMSLDPYPSKSSSESVAKEAVGEKRVGRHGHSNSVDGFSTASFEADSVLGVDGVKKAMTPDRLAELPLIDPK
ncbi:hypothetical protein TIFTF001_014181 [Ficus carica]|uniref:Uncharacterized protein n=1 Tax=Ficus carica TaxID=3494 RepID=A0AA88AR02_FICCA|nr:hypothetical protein TIFTF001_014181 [Ficus carica]